MALIIKEIKEINEVKEKGAISLVITRHDLLHKQEEDCNHEIVQFTENLQEEDIRYLCEVMDEHDEIIAVLPPQVMDKLVNGAKCPVYRFVMEHIYRDRVPADEADMILQNIKAELGFNAEHMNVLNYVDFNNADLKNVSIIEYKGLERVYPTVKIPMDKLEEVIELLRGAASTIDETTYLLPPCNGVADWSEYDNSKELNEMSEYLQKLL